MKPSKRRVATQNATNALNTYLKASNAASRPIDELQSEVDAATQVASDASEALEKARAQQTEAEDDVTKNAGSFMAKYYQDSRRTARRNFKAANEAFLAAQDSLKKANNALKTCKNRR